MEAELWGWFMLSICYWAWQPGDTIFDMMLVCDEAEYDIECPLCLN